MSTASSPPPAALAAALADRYAIERELGAGGMATVYLAQDLKHHRKVALKVLRPDLSATMGAERFVREVTIAANLQHPHILPLYDSGEAAGFLYYVMPFVEGQTLRDRLHRERELPVADAVRILRDVTDAMATAHAKGVVHRDLKPENIMLSGRHALVADFGVAKAVSEATGRNTLTTAGVALGTPTYMAPEQATADPLTDHRADLYALGVIAYEVLTGQPPFVRSTPQAMLAAHVTESPKAVTEQRSSIPAPLAAIVMRCLEKKPADRPQDAEELLAVLETVMTSSGGITPTDTRPVAAVTPTAGGQPVATRRWVRPALIAVGVLLVAGAAWFASTLRAPGVDPRVRSPVVVVPFEVRATDPSLKSMGVDAAERIAGALQQAGVGEVVPYRGQEGEAAFTEANVRKVARASKAATLVFGTVTQRGGDVEFEARVVRGGDQRLIWSLGPERSPLANPGVALDSIRERVLGAVGHYLGASLEGSVSPWLYQPPRTLEAARLYAKADELIRTSQYRAALPAVLAAAAADTSFPLAQSSIIGVSFNLPGRWPQIDSMLRVMQERRSRLMPGDALWLDYWNAIFRSPEEELRTVRAVYAQDSTLNLYSAMWSSVRARRPREALRYFARRDTSGAWGKDWQPWYTFASTAHHMLGEFAEELKLARASKELRPGDIRHWHSEIRALAAQGRFVEVDDLITKGRALEYPGAPLWLTQTALGEAERHGYHEVAMRYARESLVLAAQQTDSIQRTLGASNARRYSLRVLGERKAAVAIYDEDARRHGAAGLGNRILAMRDRVLGGDTAGALALVDSARTQPMSAHAGSAWGVKGAPMYYAAHILALLNRKEEAVALFREALNNGWRVFGDEENQWFWAPIKDYPPFLELLKLKDK